jgi:MFS transporter, MHS family, shikimate and dehydroshikimate transport protein
LERVAGEDVGQESTSMGKVAFASFIGTAIEFYDFYIYGTAAALVLGAAFFPEFSEAAGTLAAFATFAVAFFARPVGGVVFGDRVGRKVMLIFL